MKSRGGVGGVSFKEALKGSEPRAALRAFCRPRPKRIVKWILIQGVIIGLYVLAYIALKDEGSSMESGHNAARRAEGNKGKMPVWDGGPRKKLHHFNDKGGPQQPQGAKNKERVKRTNRSPKKEPKAPTRRKPTVRPTKIPGYKLPEDLRNKPLIDHGKMIVLFTYMRGGSSFLGQMFDKNPAAVYLFEPLDGVYSSMYGVPLLIPSLDITHTPEMVARRYPITEKETVSSAIYNMLSCNVDRLPTEILVHPFMYRQIKSASYSLYGKCLSKFNPESFRWKCVPFKPTCDRRPKGKKPIRCDKLGKPFVPVDPKKEFKEYNTCLQRLKNISMSCIGYMEEECRRTSVRVVKSVRLTADVVRTLLTMHPNVKIIYYLRDPRGIVRSRKKEGLLSINSQNDLVKEVKMLCEDMYNDITAMVQLQKHRPKNILIQYYEKFAMHPEKVAMDAYKFADVYMPNAVLHHLHNITHANSDTAAYETARTNATATAFAWRHELPKPLIGKMTAACKLFFQEAQKIQPLYKP